MRARRSAPAGRFNPLASTPSTTTLKPSPPCAAGERKLEMIWSGFWPGAGSPPNRLSSKFKRSALRSIVTPSSCSLLLPLIVTSSSFALTFNVSLMSPSGCPPTLSFDSAASKSFASHLSVYSPDAMFSKLKAPAASAVVFRASPVALLISVSLALGTAAPFWSSTEPLTLTLFCRFCGVVIRQLAADAAGLLDDRLSCAAAPDDDNSNAAIIEKELVNIFIALPHYAGLLNT